MPTPGLRLSYAYYAGLAGIGHAKGRSWCEKSCKRSTITNLPQRTDVPLSIEDRRRNAAEFSRCADGTNIPQRVRRASPKFVGALDE